MIPIFVMRHGQAEPLTRSDEYRELTAIGRQEVACNAEWLKSEISELDLVLVSPYVRALQTLDVLKSHFAIPTRQAVVSELEPSGSANEAHDYIDAMISLYKPRNILIVSHMPLVSYLTEALTLDKQSPLFATAAIAKIEYKLEKMKGDLVHMQLSMF